MTRSEAIGKAKRTAKKMNCLVYVVRMPDRDVYQISCMPCPGTELYVTPDQSVHAC